jgi:hypothetical protein
MGIDPRPLVVAVMVAAQHRLRRRDWLSNVMLVHAAPGGYQPL